MARLKRIGLLFFGKLVASILGMAGLAAGLLYSGVGAIYDAATTGLNTGTVLAFLAILTMPILGAIAGFVGGVAGAVIYNLSTGWFVGIETDFEVQTKTDSSQD